MWYGGSVTGGLFADPARGNFDDLKQSHDRTARADAGFHVADSCDADSDAGEFGERDHQESGGIGWCLIAVNHTTKPADVSLSSPEIKLGGRLKVIDENRAMLRRQMAQLRSFRSV